MCKIAYIFSFHLIHKDTLKNASKVTLEPHKSQCKKVNNNIIKNQELWPLLHNKINYWHKCTLLLPQTRYITHFLSKKPPHDRYVIICVFVFERLNHLTYQVSFWKTQNYI